MDRPPIDEVGLMAGSNPADEPATMQEAGSGGGTIARSLQEVAGSLVVEGRIRWRELFALLVSGWFLWLAGLLSTLISGVYRALAAGISWVIETTLGVWTLLPDSQTWLVRESFEAAARSLESEFGALAYVIGVALVIAWFVAMESIIAFFRGWLQ